MMDSDFPRTDAERRAFDRLRSRMNVGQLVVRARMMLGLTQDQVAQRAGTKQSRISELESLRGNVRFDTLDRIAEALGLEITLVPRRVDCGEFVVPAGSTDRARTFSQAAVAVQADDTLRLVATGREGAFV